MDVISKMSFLKYQLPLYIYICLIFGLSSIPLSSIPNVNASLQVDKVVHFMEYGIFGFLLFRAIYSYGKIRLRLLFLIVILSAAVLGAADESYQNLTAGRDPNFYDWLVDCLGATTSAIICSILYRKFGKALKTEA